MIASDHSSRRCAVCTGEYQYGSSAKKNKIETCDARALVEIVIYTFLLKSVSNVINSLIPQVTQDALLSPNDRQTKTASLNYASKAC